MSDWTQIKPEAGVLVELTREYQRGHWRVMRPCKNIPGQDGASFDVDHCYLPDAVPPDAKPLLPACTMDEAMRALATLPGANTDFAPSLEASLAGPTSVDVKLETGYALFGVDGFKNYRPGGGFVTAQNIEAVDRDLAKIGALRDWLNGVRERSKA